jgi:hypothetical protein
MIEKIVYSLYRKYCKEHYNRYIELELEHKERAKEVKTTARKDEFVKVFDAMKRDGVQLLGIERNRVGEYVIVCKAYVKENFWIMLYGPSYTDINKHPKIMARVEEDRTTGRNYMHIEDITMVNDDIGNGTICMQYFIEETKKCNITEIRGILSLVDQGHFDRSIHFYKKNGFEVKMDSDNRSGQIRYVIDDKMI